MGLIKWLFKMIISIALDIIDFFMPPVIGSFYDVIIGIIGVTLWGKPGALQFLELIDITDRIDAFIPMLTIAGLISISNEL